MALSVLEINKYDIFSDVEIVFVLFQTALQHHDAANGCGHDIRNFWELSLCVFGMVPITNFENDAKSLIGGNSIEMLWKIER